MKPHSGRYLVLFDADCPICVRSVKELERRDRHAALEFQDIHDLEHREMDPPISPEALERSIHLVDPHGKVREGADAVEIILTLLPGLSWISWFFRVPLVRPLARLVYRLVARNRYRLTCRRHCG